MKTRLLMIAVLAITLTIMVPMGAFAGVSDRVDALEAAVAALQTENATQQGEIVELQADNAYLLDLLQHFSRVENDVYITGANLNIVSGSGATDSPVNGLGNLIVGYNETAEGYDIRTGSHNLVLGFRNSFSGYGGIVAGYHNSISGNFANVLGGAGNSAEGSSTSILGGIGNSTADFYTWASNATIVGGYNNYAWGFSSTVGGGIDNVAAGHYSSVSGGRNRYTLGSSAGMYDWAAGSLWEDE
jgi:hypothetical protein